jgi:hypothetical protein
LHPSALCVTNDSERIPNAPSDIPAQQHGEAQPNNKLDRKILVDAIWHPVTLLLSLSSFFVVCVIYSYSLFLPTIISTMGYSRLMANVLTVPPNFIGFASVILVTQLSRRFRRIGIFLASCAAVGAVGFLLLLIGGRVGPGWASGPRIQYAGTFLVATGAFALPPLTISWASVNAAPHLVKAIVLGMVITVGNFSSFLSSFTYIVTDAPRYEA